MHKALKAWKESSRRKPLIVNGARQVGKTHALQYFGHTSYEDIAYLNFEKDEQACAYFEKTLDPKQLIKFLRIHTGVDIKPKETLLIFDEVQDCPKALTSLKYFCEEANEYHVAAAGSLLGVKTAGKSGFPVGKVNFLHLYPLTFFEFLSAIQEEKLRQFLEEYSSFEPLPLPLHEKLLHLLKMYFFVGGMPEAVLEYVRTERLPLIREVQLEILSAYERDFAKHAPASQVMKISAVWNQVHRQLAKENKKFIFAALRESARGREYEEAIQWLLDAGLISKSYLVESPKLPLSAYARETIFKIFLLDVGLLGAQSNLLPQTTITGDVLFTEFKGSLTENYVVQEMIAALGAKPYYWASEGKAEVDIILEDEGQIYPCEVKSGSSKKKKSLLIYDQKYAPSKLIRISSFNLKQDGKVANFPLYLVSRIKAVIQYLPNARV